jgi:uncharacterized protein with PIN domain
VTTHDWDKQLIDEQLAEHLRQSREPDPLGVLALECSSCKRESPVRFRDIPRLTFPVTVTLPRRYHTYMKCPGCGRRTWMRAHWRI